MSDYINHVTPNLLFMCIYVSRIVRKKIEIEREREKSHKNRKEIVAFSMLISNFWGEIELCYIK